MSARCNPFGKIGWTIRPQAHTAVAPAALAFVPVVLAGLPCPRFAEALQLGIEIEQRFGLWIWGVYHNQGIVPKPCQKVTDQGGNLALWISEPGKTALETGMAPRGTPLNPGRPILPLLRYSVKSSTPLSPRMAWPSLRHSAATARCS